MSFLYKMYRNKLVPPADPSTSFAGQTVIVTGANTGLGLEAAAKFASLGAARVILGVRTEAKGATAKETIESRLGDDVGKDEKCTIEVWKIDMGSYESIGAFARRVETELECVDVVVLNAGVYKNSFSQSAYGWEETLQVNVLSTSLLALLLLPILKKYGAKRKEEGLPIPTLELVSSGLHVFASLTEEEKSGKIDLLDHFNTAESFADHRQYGRSKLFLMYALAALQKLAHPQGDLQGTPDVWVTSVCPGACASELARDFESFIYRVGLQIASYVFLRTPEQGARSYVSGATLGEKGHGRFWQSDEIKPPAPLLAGQDGDRLQRKVWQEIVGALEKHVPAVKDLAS